MSDLENIEGGEPLADDAGVDVSGLSEVEQLAMEMGWKPKGEGVPDEKWKPAKDWLKVEREINRSLKQDLRGLREQVERMANASTKATEKALKQQADALQAQYEQARANSDVDGALAAVKGLQELQAEATNLAPQASVEEDFARRNPWYGKDDEATAFAVGIAQRLHAQGKSHAEQIAAVEEAMAKRFPELVGGTQAKTPPAVNAPNRAQPVKRPKGYADLPAHAKAAAESYAKLFKERHGKDPEQTKSEYAANYWSSQAA